MKDLKTPTCFDSSLLWPLFYSEKRKLTFKIASALFVPALFVLANKKSILSVNLKLEKRSKSNDYFKSIKTKP